MSSITAEHIDTLAAAGLDALPLTPTETLLLVALLPKGRLVTQDELARRVWGERRERRIASPAKSISTNLGRLRPKVARRGYRVVTRAGFGYRLEVARP